jgi:5-methylcytosine-specific restriction endonuclease McrA
MAIIYNADGIAGKLCNKCSEWKPVSEFSRQIANLKKGGDGYHYTCKSCHNTIRRAQRVTKRAEVNAKQRAYYQAHREKILAASHRYRELYPERIKASHRAYYERNREQRKRSQRVRGSLHRVMHREQINAYQRAYYRTQRQIDAERARQQERERERRRRNHKHNAEGSHTEAEWQMLKADYDHICLRCQRREPEITLVHDHIIPITKGGSDWITNIQPLCFSCNSSKGTKTIDYRVIGN